jgi:hypothetical protein
VPADREFLPRLLNLDEVIRLLARNMRGEVPASTDSWQASVWMLVDPGGAVPEARIQSATGPQSFRSAVLSTASNYRFAQTVVDGCAIPGWVLIPISVGASRP